MNRQSMRVVVAPDKFKGSLTAVEAAEAIGEGLRQGARRLAEASPQFHPAAERQKSGDKPTPADSAQSC